MKTLLEILGITSPCDKEKKVLQQLRDEALQEKANDELDPSDRWVISDTLNALREERIERKQSSTSKLNWNLSPTWVAGFACLAGAIFLYFSSDENPTSTPLKSSAPVTALFSSNQRVEGLAWNEDMLLVFDTASFERVLPLPSFEWIEQTQFDQVQAMLPISSVVAVYDELSQPSLPSFEIPKVSEQTFELYLQEGRRFKNNLQNNFDEMVESIGSIDLGIEG
jgi:hypothetical protein